MAKTHRRVSPVNLYIGTRLRDIRARHGLTLRELGDAIGVTAQQLQKYEAGANRISPEKMQKLADVLGEQIGYFFYGAPVDSPASLGPAPPAEDDHTLARQQELMAAALAAIPDKASRTLLIKLAWTIARR